MLSFVLVLKKHMWRTLTFLVLLIGNTSAWAGSYEQAQAAFYQGQFDQAYTQASSLQTSKGYALAAEALNAKLLLGLSANPEKTAKAAMVLARQGLQTDPLSAEAHLQYAIAYGFYGRQVSPFTAWRKKLPLKILTEIEKARASGPNDARTFALLGAWHLSVVHRAGVKKAQKLYGANEKDGLYYFELAKQIAPDDLVILANSALMRYVLAPDAQEKALKENLQKIIFAPAKNAVEARLQTQMQSILASFDKTTKSVLTPKQFITR